MVFREIFELFQQLLRENQRAMELMTDLGEKSGGEYIFDRKYLGDLVEELRDILLRLVKELNLIGANRYIELYSTVDRVFLPLEAELRGRLSVTEAMPFVIPLGGLPSDYPEIMGGKASVLGEIKQRLHLPVPYGFVITTRAYQRFLEHNQLDGKIHTWIESWISGKADERQTSRQIQYSILASVVPQDVAREIKRHAEQKKGKVYWAVRSSARGEDGELSFAGLHESLLHVPSVSILEAYKKVLVSLYSPEALIYRHEMGMIGEEAAMAVLCQEMIDSKVSGIVHTLDPSACEPDCLVIYAALGLGGTVAEGTAAVDRYLVERDPPHGIRSLEIVRKNSLLRPVSGGGVEEADVPDEDRERSSLPEGVRQDLVRWALVLERYFKRPQEVEWAIDGQGNGWVIQSRGLSFPKSSPPPPEDVCDVCPRHPVLLRNSGAVAYAGFASGPVCFVRSNEDMDHFPDGAILLTPYTAPWLARIVPKAAGIITERGTAAGHLAAIAREFRVPALVGVEGAVAALEHATDVTLDTRHRVVFEGRMLLPSVVLPLPEDICETCSHYRVLVSDQGTVAHAGIGSGPVCFVNSDEDMSRFPDGAILVTPYTAPWLTRVVPRAAGIISERGSAAGHLATIAREFRVPALVGVEGAMGLFKEGEEVTLDSQHRVIYEGRVKKLIQYELIQSSIFEDAPEFRLLRRLLKRIAPLNLIDPQAADFTPQGCMSVHDVIRFIHEKAVQELMDLPDLLRRFKGAHVWTLVSEIPLDLKILDLGGGIDPLAQGSKVAIGEIASMPFQALWEGVSGPGVWSTEPIQVDFKGMMSSLSKTWTQAGTPSYAQFNLAVISRTYMNLHLRLGYHFNLVDVRMDDDAAHNHLYFRFVGGVTDITRRSRRAELIAQILSRYHFKVDTKGDLIIGRVLHLPSDEIHRRLQAIGRLIGFTRQLDIQLRSDEDIPRFVETFFHQFSPPSEN